MIANRIQFVCHVLKTLMLLQKNDQDGAAGDFRVCICYHIKVYRIISSLDIRYDILIFGSKIHPTSASYDTLSPNFPLGVKV